MTPFNWADIIHYVPETGEMFWKISPNQGIMAGDPIRPASKKGKGYRLVQYRGFREPAMRIAWKIVHGHIPEGFTVDHENHIRDDDRLENLRLVTQADNCRNRTVTSSSASGTIGVTFHSPSGKWRARITHNGKVMSLGLFEEKEDAVAARKTAERKYGFHENHGSVGKEYRRS